MSVLDGPGEGTWSVFAAKVVAERDEAQWYAEGLRAALAIVEAERDEARAEVERLRGVLHVMSLDEYESTTSASDKVHAHARRAREALAATAASDGPSDKAHIASLEDLFLKACIRADKHKKEGADSYRRGAEAMREACAVAGQEACRNYIACGEVVAETLRALPVPEEATDET